MASEATASTHTLGPRDQRVLGRRLDPRDERALRRRLESWARLQLGVPAQDCDDLYQEAWCKVLAAGERNGCPTRSLAGAMCWAIGKNWPDELRRRQRRPTVPLDDCASERLRAPNGAADPAERAELLEALRRCFAVIASLTPRQCQIVLLADVLGLRPHEIRPRVGVSERVYQLDHARALGTLRTHVNDWREQRQDLVDTHEVGEASDPGRSPHRNNHDRVAEPLRAAA